MKFTNRFQRLVRAKSAFPLILLAACLFPAQYATGQITLVHVTSCGPESFPGACTIPSTGSGHLLVIGWNGGPGSNAVITSITDNAGSTYTQAGGAQASVSSGGWTSDIWYAANSEAGATSVTVNVSPQGSPGGVVAWEFSGISTTSPLDQTAALNDQPATATPTGAAVTTTSADELIISIAQVANTITGIDQGNPFTQDASLWVNGWAHLITSSTGTYSAQWNQSPSGVYCASTASFEAPSGPTVSSVSPNSGSTAGGTAVTITGTNFAAGATVTFGGTAATNMVVVSGTQITATTPPGSAGAETVTVTNPGAQSASLANGFTYELAATDNISYVQGNYAAPQSAETTVTVPFTAAQAAGDLNVVVVGWNDSTATVSAVADTSGNTYTRAVGPTVQSGVASQSIYYAKNIESASAGANTVTVTFATAAAYADIRILEYSGVDPNNPVDVTAAGSGSSGTSSSGSATTTNPTDLIFGANVVQSTTTGPGSGFTERLLTSPDGDIAEDDTVTTTGSYSATAPLGSSGAWITQMVAFRAEASAGGRTHLLSAAPTSLSFGNVTVGTQSVLPIVLTNTGTGAVTITLDTVLGAGFSGSGLSLPLKLSSGQNTDFSITFSPTVTGSVTGSASVVSNASDSPTVVSLSGAGVNSHYVSLSWTASTSSGVAGYNVYRSTVSGGPYTQLNSSLIAGTAYTDSAVEAGQTYYYVATAVNSSEAQSVYSKQASATIPSP